MPHLLTIDLWITAATFVFWVAQSAWSVDLFHHGKEGLWQTVVQATICSAGFALFWFVSLPVALCIAWLQRFPGPLELAHRIISGDR
jgi:hypothetical protein